MSTDFIFTLLSEYGAIVVFTSAFLSCLLVPIPTSLMMLAGGALAAAGDLVLFDVTFAAWIGAILGDQAGYVIGRLGGSPALGKLASTPARHAVLDRARALVDRRGGIGVFFSTWAIAPLGPWVNFAAGATGLSWLRFAVADILGETIWVSMYVGLGYGFASQIDMLASLIGNIAGFLAAVVVTITMFVWIRTVMHMQAQHTVQDSLRQKEKLGA